MKLTDFALLADENIANEVVAYLRELGFDVRQVLDNQPAGSSYVDLLAIAVNEGLEIVTHDSDFGALVVHQHKPVIGILYRQPGHHDANFTVGTIRTLLEMQLDLPNRFILTARRKNDEVTLRVRDLRDSV